MSITVQEFVKWNPFHSQLRTSDLDGDEDMNLAVEVEAAALDAIIVADKAISEIISDD